MTLPPGPDFVGIDPVIFADVAPNMAPGGIWIVVTDEHGKVWDARALLPTTTDHEILWGRAPWSLSRRAVELQAEWMNDTAYDAGRVFAAVFDGDSGGLLGCIVALPNEDHE
jgi:hypothetical protein